MVGGFAERHAGAGGQFAHAWQWRLHPPPCRLHLARVSRKLLPHPHGDGVLKMRTADLDYLVEFTGWVFARQAANHLVGVHVGRGATPGLEDVYHEGVVVPARGNLIGGCFDSRGLGLRQVAHPAVPLGGSGLNQPEGA
jgi:hypothetical protein